MRLPLRIEIALALATVGASVSGRAEKVDLLLVHGQIYTESATMPVAQAVAVAGDRIVFVGSNDEAREHHFEATRTIDLGGRTMVPGLNDAHMHLAGVGFRELEFNLEGTTGIADLQQRLVARVRASPRKGWLRGRGWIETHWAPATFPMAADIDAVVADRPVALVRADGHALVANAAALKLAGIDATTPNPTGGEILRDPKTGRPTGMLIDNAMTLINRLIPPATEDELAEALVVGARREATLGWTGIQVAGHDWEESQLLRRLVANGRIGLRVYDAVSGPGPESATGVRTPGTKYEDGTAAARLFEEGAVIDESGGRYTRRAVKMWMDGALGSRGAALLQPYSDYPSTGLLMHREEDLLPFLCEALRRGIQIEIHAIGDRANRQVLDLYEKAFAAVPVSERKVAAPRWRVEHAQIVAPVDIPRFAKMEVIASMQPSHAIGDLYFAPKRLGQDRLAGAYAWQSILQTGAAFCAGSDAPVERGEPMIEFYAAISRRSLDGYADADWHLEQRMTRAQILAALTTGAAYASFQESNRGAIEVGKWADLTVLTGDIMTIPEPEVLKVRCALTIVGGRVVFEAP
ncbi:MAG TPA: amidohydrolase [Candidatus Didemnitutus sp.]|nr:amidohydrolase [Candidatus Didemnitutus sp.]